MFSGIDYFYLGHKDGIANTTPRKYGNRHFQECYNNGYLEALTMQMHFSEDSEEDIKQDLIEARKGKMHGLSLRDIGD